MTVIDSLDEIRERMTRLGWSQDQLAAEIRKRHPDSGLGQSALSPILAGKRGCTAETETQIVETLRDGCKQLEAMT
ncbi:MAG: helix-turn-helix transcriptional regulator [Elusimicrobiota bacterium]|jgi:transcriptional regulator with XRE-family HTH domain